MVVLFQVLETTTRAHFASSLGNFQLNVYKLTSIELPTDLCVDINQSVIQNQQLAIG